METASSQRGKTASLLMCAIIAVFCVMLGWRDADALTIKVVNKAGAAVNGFRWLVEEDNTNQQPPGVKTAFSIGLDIHKSHAPVLASGQTLASEATVNLPTTGRYYVSVLPDSGYALGGGKVSAGQGTVTVVLNSQPLPTAQIFVLAFNDNHPINNAYDLPAESGLEGFRVVIDDAYGGGPVTLDALGNPLGTIYDANGNVVTMGNGVITTMTQAEVNTNNPYGLKVGEALIKNLYPGKYGIKVLPPAGEASKWVQTSTIEGTPVIDAWVKANEPRTFVEGFGTGTHHAQFGFVDPTSLPWNIAGGGGGTSTVTGRNAYNHFTRPPFLQSHAVGMPVPECWVGVNDPATGEGKYAAPCDANSNFSIPDVPPGTWQLVTWDKPLGALFGFNNFSILPTDGARNLGDVLSFKWFGHLEGKVFYDANLNGFREPTETMGIPQQTVNIRFRDGSVYQSTVTDDQGEYAFAEVFPFFKWLVVEVDFARFKATGMTTAFDEGGVIPSSNPANDWLMPSFGKLNPVHNLPNAVNTPAVNPHTGNNYSRTEAGPVLTQAMHLFLGQANAIDWGKAEYLPAENGGISGIVFYAVTRAENDPRYAVGDGWEPGIPRVQVNLYQDSNSDGVIDDLNGDGGPTLADVDNHPFGWSEGGAQGSEDVDRNGNGVFDAGDALNIASTDSWDDNTPTGCFQVLPVIDGQQANECFDNFGTWNQVRPGVFDGGYAFTSYFPGGMASGSTEVDGLLPGVYIVEAVPPRSYGYEIQREEDKNVDFGDAYTPSLQAVSPACVGDPHLVPANLTLFPGVPVHPNFANKTTPLCDRRQVAVQDGRNTAADFFMFTEVPKAARAVGFVNNDLAPEFDPNSPIFGEKSSPKWIPISFQDWAGNELYRTYTDEYGSYNALLPSTYTVNMPSPSGMAPNMVTVFLNHPFMTDPVTGLKVRDPFYDPNYSQMAWTFMYSPGMTSYLDTPIVPVGAFVGYPDFGLDSEPPSGTPKIRQVTGNAVSSPNQKGPLVCADGDTITLTAVGQAEVNNPDFDNLPGNTAPRTITRDFGFGTLPGRVNVVIDGQINNPVPLTLMSWSPTSIVARVPANAISGGTLRTGQLYVTRGDNAKWTEVGITLHVSAGCAGVVHVAPGGSIQTAIDAISYATANGQIIMVPPGVYKEAVIIDRNVKLQGWGAESTEIYAYPEPLDKLAAWHQKVKDINTAKALGIADTAVTFTPIEMPNFLVLAAPNDFTVANGGLIDGFRMTGSISGGGVQVFNNGDYFRISNNVISGNQGVRGGGIVVGQPGLISTNNNIRIHNNHIAENSGITEGGGGITVFAGAGSYRIAENRIVGNFTRWNGGGISHEGYSPNGVIEWNKVLFNEVFFGGQVGGEGGGIWIGGETGADPGSAGTVTVNGNLIQGNLAGSNHGGGIRANKVNTVTDLVSTLTIVNNTIVNNVSAYAGGGISLQDVVNATIINNTIANNDSTATAQAAMQPGVTPPLSTPQGAGIVAHAHSAALAAAVAPASAYANPTITNNIIWHNRSFSWDGSLNNSQGGLVPDPQAGPPVYADLTVAGTVATLNPQYCLLSDTTGYAATNRTGNPGFGQAYLNNLLFGVVLDEGGNMISARFNPLSESSGDYLIAGTAAASAAFNAGTDSVTGDATGKLAADIQTDPRGTVAGGDAVIDIGSDEHSFKGDANKDGNITLVDVIEILRMYQGLIPVDNAVADVHPQNLFGRPNGNGIVNLNDVILLLRKVIGSVIW